ncbi:MAG: septum formation initiator family protein [Lachnospiraceae bacterium]|nr:septum formation initiator family protein [Lachnospiraceae bacterium]
MRGVTFRKKKQNRLAMMSITIVVAMLLTVISINSLQLKEKQSDYMAKEASLGTQIEEQNDRAEELKELKKYTKTKKYAEEVAKDKLGLVYDDEIIFKQEE